MFDGGSTNVFSDFKSDPSIIQDTNLPFSTVEAILNQIPRSILEQCEGDGDVNIEVELDDADDGNYYGRPIERHDNNTIAKAIKVLVKEARKSKRFKEELEISRQECDELLNVVQELKDANEKASVADARAWLESTLQSLQEQSYSSDTKGTMNRDSPTHLSLVELCISLAEAVATIQNEVAFLNNQIAALSTELDESLKDSEELMLMVEQQQQKIQLLKSSNPGQVASCQRCYQLSWEVARLHDQLRKAIAINNLVTMERRGAFWALGVTTSAATTAEGAAWDRWKWELRQVDTALRRDNNGLRSASWYAWVTSKVSKEHISNNQEDGVAKPWTNNRKTVELGATTARKFSKMNKEKDIPAKSLATVAQLRQQVLLKNRTITHLKHLLQCSFTSLRRASRSKPPLPPPSSLSSFSSYCKNDNDSNL